MASLAPQTEHLPSDVIFGCSFTSAPQSPHFGIKSPPSKLPTTVSNFLANKSYAFFSIDRARANVFTFLFTIVQYSDVMFALVKWEYRVVPIKTSIHTDHFTTDSKPIIDDIQNDLNELGREGWELVGVQDISLADGRRFTVAYLKKQDKH